MKKFLCLFLAVLLLLSICACNSEQKTVDPVLAERRDIAERYMRSMSTVLWSPETDILYTRVSKKAPEEASPDTQMLLKADRIYRGMPYSYAGSTLAAFLEYASQPDESGLYTVSDLPWKSLSGNSSYARIGSDGSSAIALAWSQVGHSVSFASTEFMTPKNGYLRVGNYAAPADSNSGSDSICKSNGLEVMCAAYAQLQKADALVSSLDSGGHAMMVADTQVYEKNGVIDAAESYVTILEQSKEHFLNEEHYTDEQLGKEVYAISGIDIRYTFQELYIGGYLPVTCVELTDPAPVQEVKITDSIIEATLNNFLQGYIICNHSIDTVTITVTDVQGNTVQEAALRTPRNKKEKLGLDMFAKEDPDRLRGFFDPAALPEGTYHFSIECRLVNGQTFITREIDLTV